jgi:hypothetical protein
MLVGVEFIFIYLWVDFLGLLVRGGELFAFYEQLLWVMCINKLVSVTGAM